MTYQLQQRRFKWSDGAGSSDPVSIGYWETIETFEDLQLALKEEANLARRWSQTYRVIEVQK